MRTLREMVDDQKVQFLRYCDGNLWYRTQCGFEFPVPIAETGLSAFYTEDRAILFTTWIRRHRELVLQARASQEPGA